MALALGSASAQINDADADGYLFRAKAMYADGNYVGCIQQLRQAEPAVETQFLKAMAAYRQGDAEALSSLETFIADNPSSVLTPQAILAAGNILFDRHQWFKALDMYSSTTSSSLNDEDAEQFDYRKAYCLLRTDKPDAAAPLFTRLLSTRNYANNARFYLAYIAYSKENYAEALRGFNAVNRSDQAPVNMTEYYLSQLYYNKGDYSKALTMAQKLLSRQGIEQPFMAEAARVAGESAFETGDTEKAVKFLRQYRSLTENPLPSALYVLGISEYESGDYADALADFTPVAELDNAMAQSASLYIGQCHMHQGNYSSALLALDRAFRMAYEPEIQEVALYNYAVAKMQGGRIPFGSSVATFESFLKRFPKSRFAPEVQSYIITGYITDNNYEAALNSINAIKHPTEATLDARQQVLYTLGTRYLNTGETAKAMNCLRQAKAMTGRNAAIAAECDLWMGETLFKEGKFSQASQCYSDYLKNSASNAPNRALAYYDLGYSLFGEKKFAQALDAFKKFNSMRDNASPAVNADAFNRMADCEYYNSNFSQAASLYDKAYETNPSAGDYALYQKAIMKGLRRDHKGKIEGLAQMMQKFPTSGLFPSALLETADAYSESGDNKKVIETYNNLVEKYPNTAQGRQGMLLLAITHLSDGNRLTAMETYRNVISRYPSSDEARVAADDLKKLYVEDDRSAEFISFMKSVPDAPEIDPSEIEELSFRNAEKAFNADGATRKVESYLRDYPDGQFVPQASLMMAKASAETDSRRTIAYTLTIVDKYPHSSVIEEALLLKAKAELNLEMDRDALETYRKLESVASSSGNLNAARLGIIRTASLMDENQTVLDATERMLASTTVGATERDEVNYARAVALNNTSDTDGAEQIWRELSLDLQSVYGTKAAFALASRQFEAGDLSKARATVENLIEANPPHNYWMARAFILLSDIYRAEGNKFEADEYLRSLRENYPGKEADIFTMIDQRLQ